MKRLLTVTTMLALMFLAACDLEPQEPDITIDNVTTDEDAVEFDLEIDDPDDALIEIDIILYDESDEEVTSLSTDELDGITIIEGSRFFNLAQDMTYTIVVEADYELEDIHQDVVLDEHTVEIDEFRTPNAKISDAVVVGNEIVFDLLIEDEYDVLIDATIHLFDDGGEEVAVIDEGLVVGVNEDVSFWNLYFDTTYEIEVRVDFTDGYLDRSGVVIESHTFTTEEAVEPEFHISEPKTEGHEFHFDLLIEDASGILDDVTITLTDDLDNTVSIIEADDLVLGLNENLMFDFLEYDATYHIEVTADYYEGDTLLEGVAVLEHTFTTDAFIMPSGVIDNIHVGEDYVIFDALIEDEAHTITFPAVFLIDPDNPEDILAVISPEEVEGFGVGLNEDLIFENLTPGATYEIILLCDYFDGNEEDVEILDNHLFTP